MRGGYFVAGGFIVVAAWQMTAARLGEYHGDFVIYENAARCLYENPQTPIHDGEPGYVYPPFLAVAIRPFHAIPQPWRSLAWDLLRWSCIGIALCVCHRRVTEMYSASTATIAAGFCIVAGLRPLWHDTWNGNVNAFLLLASMMGWQALATDKPLKSGAAWSVIAAMKPASSAILLAPLVRRPSRIVSCWASCVAGLLATTVLLPVIIFGWHVTWIQIAEFPEGAATPTGAVFTRFSNFSLGLATARLWGVVTGTYSKEPDASVFMMGRIVSGIFLAVVLAMMMLRLRRRNDRRSIDYAVAGLCVGSTLISPVVWFAHYLALTPAYAVLVGETLSHRSRRMRTLCGIAVFFCSSIITAKATILKTLVWGPLALLAVIWLLTYQPLSRESQD
jgi:hypothetical protein